uniref:AI-2E family transporter n=1 Tax=Acetatifactor sp. TaxID=1872090 RepID=UPI004055D3D9
MNIEWKSCFRIGVSALILFLCIHYCDTVFYIVGNILSAAAPVFIGFIIAYILNILMSFYERHYFVKHGSKKFVAKSRRAACMVLALLTLVGIVALVVRLVIPELISCVSFLISEIPPAIEQFLKSEFVVETLPATVLSELSGIDWRSSITTVLKAVTSGLGTTVNTIFVAVSSVVSGVVTAFISLIFAIYLLLGKEQLQGQCKRLMNNYFRPKWVNKIMYVAKVVNDSFHRYIVGQCTEAVILGILCMIGMLICGLPYAPMIGTLIGFTALIPVAGAYIGAGVGVIMILTESPVEALVFLIFIVIIQQIEGNLIYPKVVGNSIGLPAIWVLATVTIGGSLMGISGMLIGVPIAAALYRLIRDDVNRREKLCTAESADALEGDKKRMDAESVQNDIQIMEREQAKMITSVKKTKKRRK